MILKLYFYIMPKENIISGGLEGDGIEGHRKKVKKTSSRDNVEDLDSNMNFQSGERSSGESVFGKETSGKSEGKTKREERSSEEGDIFDTGFGSFKSVKKYRENSHIGSDSDIFSNGFGSKDAGWMSGRRRKSTAKPSEPYEGEKTHEIRSKTEEGDIFATDIASHPLETSEEREERKVSESRRPPRPPENGDPFYTGFGYTDQRSERESEAKKTAHSGLKTGGPVKKKKPQKELSDEDDDDLFS
ncbi:hypothetical protein J2128_001296 [Methanomicrobium sp. W14]|uniref:hypothetical protein n=1 Tax=Methanomicrobium sp. W14 TaxID=2817839 RepID=UPI001AE63190|nr:hypothetical protein [Methanomicrobium sp. W14]MBP2133342.1 hypothetical protein [Methanomicrobium sp. W14]